MESEEEVYHCSPRRRAGPQCNDQRLMPARACSPVRRPARRLACRTLLFYPAWYLNNKNSHAYYRLL